MINFKLRLRNKATLVGLISILALLGNQVAGLFGVDYSAQIEQLVTIAGTVLTLLAGLGVIVDGTTKGISDSGMAMELTKPRDENVDPVEFTDGGQLDYVPEEDDTIEIDSVEEEDKEDNPKG